MTGAPPLVVEDLDVVEELTLSVGVGLECVAQLGTQNVTVDRCTFDNLGMATWEGRLSLNQGATNVTISNSHFGNGGCSDGIFLGNVSNIVIRGNVFEGLIQGSCGPHVDSIQFYGSQTNTVIDGNFLRNNTTGIIEYDGGSTGTVATNNVLRDIERGDECLTFSGSRSPRVEHNVTVQALVGRELVDQVG